MVELDDESLEAGERGADVDEAAAESPVDAAGVSDDDCLPRLSVR